MCVGPKSELGVVEFGPVVALANGWLLLGTGDRCGTSENVAAAAIG